MDKFRFLIYGILLSLTFQATDVYAALSCGSLEETIKKILTEDHLAISAVGSLTNGLAIIIFMDDKGNFKIVGVDDKKRACSLMDGVELRGIMEQQI